MKQRRLPIAKEGLPFFLPMVLITVIVGIMGWKVWMSLGILLSLFIAYFFRNPRRQIPDLQNIVLSPADGRVVYVGECKEDRFLKERALKVSIFMSLDWCGSSGAARTGGDRCWVRSRSSRPTRTGAT